MMPWWELADESPDAKPLIRAVAYYRHSAQDRQENSIPIQQEQVRAFADENGIEIVHEFSDAGKSGLNAEGRPAFTEMMDEWVTKRNDFKYVLCLDVSRWGRFQDIDLSAEFSARCRKHGKDVFYTAMGKPKENDPLYSVYVQFERFRAAQYSRELSDKVWRGCAKITEQGYLSGGKPPYGLARLLLDERKEPLHILEPGQRKGIQNQRVTLTEGQAAQVAIVQRIFREFVEAGHSEYRIAEGLNADKISSPGGHRWAAGSVRTILRREKYIGSMVWNQTSQKLKTPRRHNPPEKWVLTPEAFDGIISQEQFARAQQIMEERRRKYDPDRLLEKLDALRKEYDLVSSSLLRSQEDMAGPSTYSRYFGSLDLAFQQLFPTVRNEARRHVQERICEQVPEVLPYSDFLVLDQKLTVAIQPAVPVTWGYSAYWPIRRDGRQVVDVTLGVLLGDSEQVDILGYVVLPRWIVGESTIRFSCTSIRTELFGRTDLGFLDQWLGEVTHG